MLQFRLRAPKGRLDRQDGKADASTVKPLGIQDARQQFLAIAERAAGGEPQIITKHGKPFVVVISAAEWQAARPKQRTLLEALRSCPVSADDLDLTRSDEMPREIAL